MNRRTAFPDRAAATGRPAGWWRGVAAAGLLMVGLLMAGWLCTGTAAAVAAETPVGRNNDVITLLKSSNGNGVGARSRLRNLPLREVTPMGIVSAVGGGNLDVLTALESQRAAQTRIGQRLAAFDPTFFTNSSYTNADTRGRYETIGRLRNTDPFSQTNTTTDADGNVLSDTGHVGICTLTIDGEGTVNATGNGVTEDGELASSTPCFGLPVYSEALEAASSPSLAVQTVVNSVGINQRFRFGGEVTASVAVTRRQKYGFTAPALTSPLSAFDPFGWNEDLFWTSSASIAFTTPLPYTKGFGSDGNTNWYNVRAARMAVTRGDWTIRSTRNAAIGQAMTSYWDMVQAAETARLLSGTRRSIESRLAAQRRLFDSGMATQYDVLQIEVELANLSGREELAWDQFLSAGRKLQTLMHLPRGEILVPAPLGNALENLTPPRFDFNLYDRAIARHPDVQLSDIDYQSSRLALRYRANQALPDISFTATASVGQNDSAFGYATAAQSLAKLTKPDSANLYFGFRYKIPLGNVAAEAGLQRAKAEERQAFDRQQQVRQQVASAVDDALTGLNAALTQVRRSEADRELARQAYQRAVEMRDQWLVSEFEVLNRFNDTLNADMAWVLARVAAQRARSKLMSAQGLWSQEGWR